MEEVQALCDRVGIMDRGKLIACDTVPNLIARLGGAVIEVGIASTDRLDTVKTRLESLELVKEVEAIPAVESEVDSHAVTLRVRTEQPNRVLPGLVTTLGASDVPLLTLNIREPNLEDVFLTLTGKTLRD
jgi:ABC-2 type transport system ATP-binding protein